MINKTFRLFISSTFDDFSDEREILNNEVFQEIDSFCQQKGYNFQLIDLRWGISNESAINQNTLDICLDEVKRCKRLSPKPNFLIMAGERYGWIPLPSKIIKTDFEKILFVASDKEKAILLKWYLLDENEIGGEYYLKTRTDNYINHDIWKIEENLIHKALINCVLEKLNFTEEEARPYISSATEHEIIEGLLNNKGVANNTIAIFRTGYAERDDDQTRIINLKKRILKKMSDDNCCGNIMNFIWDSDYLARFERAIIDVLKSKISEEIKRLEQEQNNNATENIAILEDDIPVLFERPSELKHFSDYVYGEKCVPMFLTGDSGSGKTTLLAEFIKRTDMKCIYSFYGLNDNSYTLIDAIKKITETLRVNFSIEGIVEINYRNITEILYKAIFSVPENEKLLIIIDGLDMFHDINNIFQSVFPSILPQNVKLIVSAADSTIAKRFFDESYYFYKLGSFNPTDSKKNLFAAMKFRNRFISSDIQNRVISDALANDSTPLQIKLLTEVCSAWHSGSTDVSLPSSAENIALLHLENMYNKYGHDKELVLYTLSLIAEAPFGIMEEEILLLLFEFSSVKAKFISEDHHKHNLKKLPFVIWSRLFYDLKGCLSLGRNNGNIVVKFSHNIFYHVLVSHFNNYYEEAINKLIEFYLQQSNYISEEKHPNMRKAYNLPALLLKKERVEEYKSLLNDLTYVDSVIRAGNISTLLKDIQYIIEKCGATPHLKNLYFCLQRNRSLLSFFKCEFFSCWDEGTGLPPIIQPEKITDSSSYIYFPYPASSTIKWFNNGEKYAVINFDYIFICDSKNNSEYCSIYIPPKKDSPSVISDFVWIHENKIAVTTSNEELLVYDFSDRIPNIIISEKINTDSSFVRYAVKSEILLYQDGKSICGVNLRTNKKLYEVRIKRKSPINFYIDEVENTVYYKDSPKTIHRFDLKSGKPLKKIKAKSNYGLFNNIETSVAGFSINKISDTLWAEQTPLFHSLVTFLDINKKTQRLLHPPLYFTVIDTLIGKNEVLFICPDLIICVNLKTDYTLKYYNLSGINNVSWIEPDKRISVLTDDGLLYVTLESFISSEHTAFFHKKNVFGSVTNYFLEIPKRIKIINYFIKLLTDSNALSYLKVFDYISSFSIIDQINPFNLGQTLNLIENDIASIVSFATDGKKAVSYEKNNTVLVFDRNEQLLYKIENLKLSLDDNILKLEFSQDSQKLLLWRNHSVHIIQLESGDVILELDVSFRPVLDIWFKSDSEIAIVLCDGKEYAFILQNKLFQPTSNFPEKLVKSVSLDNYVLSYGAYKREDGTYNSLSYLADSFDLEYMPYQWFKNEHIYNGKSNWLYYKNGLFYLNGDMEKPFSSKFYDFNQCLQNEQLSDSTPFKSYIREKNDCMSSLIELGNNYIVLVSRRISSIIIFDLSQMKIISAYKFKGLIIGDRMIDDKTIEVILDRIPYSQIITLNLPDKAIC